MITLAPLPVALPKVVIKVIVKAVEMATTITGITNSRETITLEAIIETIIRGTKTMEMGLTTIREETFLIRTLKRANLPLRKLNPLIKSFKGLKDSLSELITCQ